MTLTLLFPRWREWTGKPAGGAVRERTAAALVPGMLMFIRQSLRRTASALAQFWRLVRPVLRVALQFLLALIILFEEWGWRPLAELLGRFARWRPWAQLEYGIARLPPYVALFVFGLPTLLLLPLKFLAVFLIANGQVLLASLLFIAAKVVATALVARLFMLTHPTLMQIGWFARAYDLVMPWKDALTDRVRTSRVWQTGRLLKEQSRRIALAQWRKIRPQVRDMRAAIRAGINAALVRARAFAHRVAAEIRSRLASAL